MNDLTKSLIATGGVLLSVGAVIAGVVTRDRVDLGTNDISAPSAKLSNLVASREPQVPEGDYYDQMVELVKREYYGDVKDDQKLASGAVRGMVQSLGDPNSQYMDKDQFTAYKQAMDGKYTGIGAVLALVSNAPKKQSADLLGADVNDKDVALSGTVPVPRLTVIGLTPGGPGDKAGMKVGDTIEYVSDHWVINATDFQEFTNLRQKVEAQKAPMKDLIDLRKVLKAKTEKSLLPMKAKYALMLGVAGDVKVVWSSQGKTKTATIGKMPTQMPAFKSIDANQIYLPIRAGVAKDLKAAVDGKKTLTIDLRNNPMGDFDAMRECLEVLAPKGSYGYVTSDRAEKTEPLEVLQGNPNPPQLTLLVDKTTRGPAEILALALSSKGLAKLSGQEMGGDRFVKESVQLPDGSGYTLVTGVYKTSIAKVPAKGSVASKGVSK